MSLAYERYKYIFPPRPESALPPTLLPDYEVRSWWGQAKFNGANTMIYVPPDRSGSLAMGRHGPANRIGWQPGERWLAFERTLPGRGWYVFQGELLHTKGIGVRDTIFLFDLLVDDGEYLVGTMMAERQHRLGALLPTDDRPHPWTHREHFPGVWSAVNHNVLGCADFRALYEEGGRGVEGLVLKDPNAKLLPCLGPNSNRAWQAKCRRATDHLSF